MKLATIRTREATAAVRIAGDQAVEIGFADVGRLLQEPNWPVAALEASGAVHPLGELDYAPLVPRPAKIICVGLNYAAHIREMGRVAPEYPTLFAKFATSLIGANDPIELPTVSAAMDWEAELAFVIGYPARTVAAEDAPTFIAGYTIFNDVTARDWQYRTTQWLQGKAFDTCSPLGPHLVTADELGVDAAAPDLRVEAWLDDELVQSARTRDLVFTPSQLVAYISSVLTLEPGDVIATGTPSGVGHGRNPPRYITDDSVLLTRIEGLGECTNDCRLSVEILAPSQRLGP